MQKKKKKEKQKWTPKDAGDTVSGGTLGQADVTGY